MSSKIFNRSRVIKALEGMGMKDTTALVGKQDKVTGETHNELMNPQRRMMRVFKNKSRIEQFKLLKELEKAAENVKNSRKADEDLLNKT